MTDEEYGDLKVIFGVGDVTTQDQQLKVIYDGMVQETLTIVKGDTEVSFIVPFDFISDGELCVTLRFPQAVSEYRLSGWEGGEQTLQAVEFKRLVVENE